MDTPEDHWEQRVAASWQTIDDAEPNAFIAKIDALAGELHPDDAIGPFERAAAQDSCGPS